MIIYLGNQLDRLEAAILYQHNKKYIVTTNDWNVTRLRQKHLDLIQVVISVMSPSFFSKSLFWIFRKKIHGDCNEGIFTKKKIRPLSLFTLLTFTFTFQLYSVKDILKKFHWAVKEGHKKKALDLSIQVKERIKIRNKTKISNNNFFPVS